MNTQEKIQEVAQIRGYACMGTENHYRTIMPGVNYTDGVKNIADTLGAHWLIDLIASHQLTKKVGQTAFQVWRLSHCAEAGWVARCWSDTPMESEMLAEQFIPYSDFPEELAPFDLWVEGGVILLAEEH